MGIYERTCQQCGVSFQGGPRAWYCPDCRLQRKNQTTADYRNRKRAGKVREIGSIDICQNCGEKYVVNSGLQRYCKKCAPEMIKELDQRQGMEYYRKNKDKINPTRTHPDGKSDIVKNAVQRYPLLAAEDGVISVKNWHEKNPTQNITMGAM